MSDDQPQYTVIARQAGTRFTVVHSRYESRDEAESAKDQLDTDINRHKFTCHLTVVEL